MAELTENASENPNYRLPDAKTLKNACQISLTEDKPIMMDYWASSFDQSAIIGVQDDKKMLIKSEQEYTSYIVKVYKITVDAQDNTKNDYIIMTENSIYLAWAAIATRKVTMD